MKERRYQMRGKSKGTRLIISLTIIFFLAAIPARANALELKFAHTLAPTDTMHMGALKFAELVKKKTGDTLTVTIYPAGQLGNDTQILQGVRLGTIDIAMSGIPWHAGFAPFLNVHDLPFLFRDYDHAYRVLDGEIGQELLKHLETVGIKGLGFVEIGFRNLTNNKRPVRTPDDVKGLKLRTTGNPYHVLAWKLLGAIPTPMPSTEIYMACKTGTVDGQENPVTHIHGMKWYEVQKYLSLTMHAYSSCGVDMNLKKYQSLTSSQQKALVEAMHEAAVYHRNLNRQIEGPALKEMKQKGLIVIEDPDREAFAKVVKEPVQEEFAKKFGWDMIKKINQVK